MSCVMPGISYGDYVEQITCLLFLKMDQERAEQLDEPSIIPAQYRWDKLRDADGRGAGPSLQRHADRAATEGRPARRHLPQGAEQDQRPGQAAAPRQADRRRDLARPRRGREGRHLRGPAGAQRRRGEVRRRPILHPAPAHRRHGRGDRSRSWARPICDPACGTGGFLLSAYEHMKRQTGGARPRQAAQLRSETFAGFDIVPGVVRLAR